VSGSYDKLKIVVRKKIVRYFVYRPLGLDFDLGAKTLVSKPIYLPWSRSVRFGLVSDHCVNSVHARKNIVQ